MSKGSYRGGSTLTGWNANGYLPASRKLKGKGRTAQTKAESTARDELIRTRHGLMPRKPNLAAKDEAKIAAKQNHRKKSRRPRQGWSSWSGSGRARPPPRF